MMSNQNIDLIAAYFTISGDVYPFGPTEISPFSFKDRVEAAAEAGYKGLGLVHPDLMATVDRYGYKEIRRILDANGIKHFEVEFLTDWYKTGEKLRLSHKMRDEMFEVASEVGLHAIKVAPGVGEDTADIPLMAEKFAELADGAKANNTSLMLEIMPFSNVRTIDTALGIVQGADRDNAGLMLDIWHLARGNVDFSEISKVPVKFIKGIELDDADKYAVEPLWMDTISRRRLPGEGVLDINRFITEVKKTGYEGPWGVEILSEAFRKLPLEQMAKESFDKTIRFF
jgi:sugar phosphate isomerase/epimerase